MLFTDKPMFRYLGKSLGDIENRIETDETIRNEPRRYQMRFIQASLLIKDHRRYRMKENEKPREKTTKEKRSS